MEQGLASLFGGFVGVPSEVGGDQGWRIGGGEEEEGHVEGREDGRGGLVGRGGAGAGERVKSVASSCICHGYLFYARSILDSNSITLTGWPLCGVKNC